MTDPLGYQVFCQHWATHQAGRRKPKLITEWFADLTAANARKAELRTQYPNPQTLITVRPAAPSKTVKPTRKRRQSQW